MFFGVGWLCWMLWPDCLLNMCMCLCSFVSFCFYLSFIDSPWFGFRLFGVYAGLLVFRPSPCLALIECKIQIEAVAVVSFQCKLHVKFFYLRIRQKPRFTEDKALRRALQFKHGQDHRAARLRVRGSAGETAAERSQDSLL